MDEAYILLSHPRTQILCKTDGHHYLYQSPPHLEPVKPQFHFTGIWNWTLGSDIKHFNKQTEERELDRTARISTTDSNYDKSFASSCPMCTTKFIYNSGTSFIPQQGVLQLVGHGSQLYKHIWNAYDFIREKLDVSRNHKENPWSAFTKKVIIYPYLYMRKLLTQQIWLLNNQEIQLCVP